MTLLAFMPVFKLHRRYLSTHASPSLPLAVPITTFSSPHCQNPIEGIKRGEGPIFILLGPQGETKKNNLLFSVSPSILTEIRKVLKDMSAQKTFFLQIYSKSNFVKFNGTKESNTHMLVLTVQKNTASAALFYIK